MPHFYTRKGDDGYTGMLGEGRYPKYHPCLDAVGTLDEASAAIGLARSSCRGESSSQLLIRLQNDLYHIMSEIAATPENVEKFRKINSSNVEWLEKQIKQLEESVQFPHGFILPGDSEVGAVLSLSRTIIRRAERIVALLVHDHALENKEILRYLNRASSLLFVLELHENALAGKHSPTLAGSS